MVTALDPHLKKLLLFSDGASFLDYCFLGISHTKISSIIENNVDSVVGVSAQGKGLVIVKTSGVSQYLIEPAGGVTFKNEDGGVIQIADSFYQFLDKFVIKMDILLTNFDGKNHVAYFEDDNMPDGLDKW